jgi:signal transduction histidine kinase
VVDDVIRQQAELAKQRQVKLTAEKPQEACRFSFDKDLLTVALGNLVQNAIQASGEGQQVNVQLERGANDVKIRVTDHGGGIPPQHLESIFNPFFTTKPQGVGLGLPIVAKIVDEHQGQIDVKSEENEGTTFEVTLPLSNQ